MKKYLLTAAVGLTALFAAAPASANSTFPYTCSNIGFAYSGNNATLQAVCLQANGSPHATSLTLQGISNQNGILTQGGGGSTFQQSCGSIMILNNGPIVTLSAYCRTSSGSSNSTSMSLNNIGNNNGNLVQQ